MQAMWVKDLQVLWSGAGGFSPSLRTLKALGLNAILSPQGVKRAVTRGVRGRSMRVITTVSARGRAMWGVWRRQGDVPEEVLGGTVRAIA